MVALYRCEWLYGFAWLGVVADSGTMRNDEATNSSLLIIRIFIIKIYTHFFRSLQYDDTSNGLWQVNGNDSYIVEIIDANDSTFYFPMLPVTDFIIQEVDATSSITRCNQSTNVWLTYTNKSSESTSGYVHLTLPCLKARGF